MRITFDAFTVIFCEKHYKYETYAIKFRDDQE